MSGSDPHPLGPAPHQGPELDLNTAAATGNLVVSAETREDPLDQQHRHAQETAEADLRRWKERTRFSLCGLLLVTITAVALYLALSPRSGADEKTWGRTGLASILTGVAGYFIGRSGKD